MDFWDLTKLLLRQWRLALPVLLATTVLTVLTLVHVKPYYVSTAYVQLVTPTPVAAPVGQTPPDFQNPWLTQGLTTLGNAALVTVQDLTYAHELKSEGYSDNYTVQLGGGNPLVVFTITGKSRTQARDTANVIIARYEKSMADLQKLYGVATPDLITGQRLDTGSNITISSGRVKRDVLLVIAVGLLSATGASLLGDLQARRRTRSVAEAQAGLILASGAGRGGVTDDAAPVAPVSPAYRTNAAFATVGKSATASAKVPPANRATPPRIDQVPDRADAAAPVSGNAAVPSRSGPPSTAEPAHRAGWGAGQPAAASPAAMAAERSDRKPTGRVADRDRAIELRLFADVPLDDGGGQDAGDLASTATTTGPTMTGPTMTGPTMTGPTMTGPTMTGPTMTGPTMTGPTMTGPTMTGPTMTGPTTTGHAVDTGSAPDATIVIPKIVYATDK